MYFEIFLDDSCEFMASANVGNSYIKSNKNHMFRLTIQNNRVDRHFQVLYDCSYMA